MNRCRLCVIPDTRPDTAFIDGICSACVAYHGRPKIDWTERREQLDALLARMRRTANMLGNDFDCIVPSSGGKDSHYQVLTLIALGARPLVVTAATCHLTAIGRANIDNLARHATTIEITPNRTVRAKLNRIGLTMVGDISWPEHVAIFTLPFRAAAATRIPFIFYGENPQNQYGGPSEESQAAQQMTKRWRSEFGGFLGLRPSDLVGTDGLTVADMRDYMIPEQISWLEAHFLGQYLPWDSHQNAEVALAAGMRQERPAPASFWKHENLDNAQTGLHDQGMYRKYGFGRYAAQASVDIRSGLLTRETVLEWVEKYDGAFPYKYAGVGYEEVLARIGVSKDQLWDALDRFTNWNIFSRTDRKADGVPHFISQHVH